MQKPFIKLAKVFFWSFLNVLEIKEYFGGDSYIVMFINNIPAILQLLSVHQIFYTSPCQEAFWTLLSTSPCPLAWPASRTAQIIAALFQRLIIWPNLFSSALYLTFGFLSLWGLPTASCNKMPVWMGEVLVIGWAVGTFLTHSLSLCFTVSWMPWKTETCGCGLPSVQNLLLLSLTHPWTFHQIWFSHCWHS